MAAFFSLALGIGRKESKDGALTMNVLGVFRPILQDFCWTIVMVWFFALYLQMMAKTNRENTIRKIQQLSQQTMPKGTQVMLYGSQARGDAREDSDWDILIILDKPKVEQSDHDNIAFPFTMLGWELGEAIIPVIYTREEWANSSFMPFYKNVERDKIILQWVWTGEYIA